jgi:hypothetical protein
MTSRAIWNASLIRAEAHIFLRELLAEPQAEEPALQLFGSSLRMAAPEAGHGVDPGGLDRIADELEFARHRHAFEDLQLDSVSLGVCVQRQGRVADLVWFEPGNRSTGRGGWSVGRVERIVRLGGQSVSRGGRNVGHGQRSVGRGGRSVGAC